MLFNPSEMGTLCPFLSTMKGRFLVWSHPEEQRSANFSAGKAERAQNPTALDISSHRRLLPAILGD